MKTNEDLATALLASSKAISTFNAALAGMTEHDDLVEMMENVRAITVEAKAEKAKESVSLILFTSSLRVWRWLVLKKTQCLEKQQENYLDSDFQLTSIFFHLSRDL